MSITAGRTRASGHYLRKRLRTARWSRRIAVFSGLVLVVSILVYRLGGIDLDALKALFWTVLGLAVLALLVALGGLARVWRSGHEGGGPAVGAVFVALLVMVPYGIAAILASEHPRTNTAETDGMLAADIVGGAAVGGALETEPTTPDAGTRPQVSSRRFQARAAQVYAVARIVLGEEGWRLDTVDTGLPQDTSPETADLGISGTIEVPLPTARSSVDLAAASDPFVRPDSDEYVLRAAATSPILALPSDVTIRIVEDGTETFVDLRSTSLSVSWDLGQNRRFIESFLEALEDAMAGVAAVVPPGADG